MKNRHGRLEPRFSRWIQMNSRFVISVVCTKFAINLKCMNIAPIQEKCCPKTTTCMANFKILWFPHTNVNSNHLRALHNKQYLHRKIMLIWITFYRTKTLHTKVLLHSVQFIAWPYLKICFTRPKICSPLTQHHKQRHREEVVRSSHLRVLS